MEHKTEMNNSYELKIFDLSSDGRGVTKLPSGRVVMIPNCLPGDKISAIINEDSEGKSDYKVLTKEIIEPSPDRIPHNCEHSSDGCQGSIFGALDYRAGLELKQKMLVETLKRIGKFDNLEVEPIIPSTNQWKYRDRVELKLTSTEKSMAVSFSGINGDVCIRNCQLAKESINQALSYIKSNTTSSTENSSAGNRLLIRDNGHNQSVGVLYFLEKLDSNKTTRLTGWLNSLGLNGWQIRETKLISTRFTKSKLVSSTGNTNIYIKIGKKELIASPNIFTQANADMSETLINVVLKSVPNNCRLLDLYGGYGSFGITHAMRGGQSDIVESMKNSIIAGRTFCKENSLKVKFITSNLNQKADWMKWQIKYGACIVDPPHSGLSETIRKWLQARGADRLIYVSCHPAALARDIRQLTNYKISEIQPIDMFPQTTELESVVVLDRK